MANYNTSATVTLSVNGRQAQQMLKRLQTEAKTLETKLATAAKAGDKASMVKLQKELRSTNRTIQQLQNSTKSVEQVLRSMDRATPRELQRTLRTLQSQLQGIQRGSAAWDAQVAKIKMVKTEIAKLNGQLATTQSTWTRMNNWLNNSQMAIMGVAAAVAGLVMAGRKAVNAFADIEEELANTRKYTGLSEQEVTRLNEVFKKMDTRTPRAKLNELAQEAGRLGKNTLDSVQGYVEAADIINVALVDLGEGATQTIAKLTNIFGVEKLLGTKDAMLAVGSTVNVLSQNCTASKPYLVEFAQRMAGIGSQAGLSIPEILAFGAVLDANGQKVEMSATAIQKVIMNLANKNREFAATLGLDADKLNSTLKKSAKEGLLMFLERLREIGESSGYNNATMSLAPAFKEMGLDAARVSQVLSTLAKHVDEVKWQMGNAENAFRSATSATHEYEIFNNTAQASIDKAKKRVSELAIELGEKLYPVMKHIYTSSGIFLRVLNTMVSFFITYRREILVVVIAVVAYTVAVKGSTMATALWSATSKAAHGVMLLCKTVVVALKIAYFELTGNVTRAAAATRVFNAVCKASPVGLLLAVITAVIGGLVAYAGRMKEAKEATAQARKEAAEWKKSLTDISASSAEYCAAESSRLKLLYDTAVNEAKSKDERRKAAEKLQALYPDYFKNLSTEDIMVGRAKNKYDQLTASIRDAARARAAGDKITENEKQRLTLEDELAKQQTAQRQAQRNADNAKAVKDKADKDHRDKLNKEALGDVREVNSSSHRQALVKAGDNLSAANKALASANNAVAETQRKITAIDKANEELAKKYNLANKPDLSNPDYDLGDATPYIPGAAASAGGSGGGSSAAADRFAAEKDWKEQEEALNRIEYATGKKDYLAYTERMDEIAVEFYEKQLKHKGLSSTEQLSITAQWREAQKKQAENAAKEDAQFEQDIYDQQLAQAKQAYIDGTLSQEAYNEQTQRIELQHLQAMVGLYAEGTAEREKAEDALRDYQLKSMEARQRKTQELEAKYKSMKDKFFGDNPSEKQSKYDADLALLKVAYDRELAAAGSNASEKLRIEEAFEKAKLALRKQYGLEGADATQNSMQKAVAKSVEWLNSDGGKAMTGTMETLTSGMSAVFSQLSSVVQAELEIQTAAINKRYETETAMAEGNSYRVRQLEKRKEKEIAQAKNNANRKMFAMQVIQAVAQTAQNAISAYGSAAAIPIVGYLLAPIAAGMAVAAGMIQIAAIKKQAQASEAQGYAEGGFTPSGRRDQAVGIVHAGEWVASQRLVSNPQVRPLLQALDYAQRTNTIGSLRAEDVSRSIMAPVAISQLSSRPPQIVVQAPTTSPESSEKLNKAIDVLNSRLLALDSRLKEPFAAITTITGDLGIKKAQDDYAQLIKNKSPKWKSK